MTGKVCTFLFSVLISFSVHAQKDKLKFHSIYMIGLADGQNGGYALLQTINGVEYKKWLAGIGIGADHYPYKSYPLFFDVSRSFGTKDKGFVYGDLGYNFPGKNKPGKEVYYYNSYHFTGGLYSDIGIGCKIQLVKKASVLLSSGFSYKKLKSRISVVNPCLVGPCPEDISEYNYGYGRIVFKAGLAF
jgi:hypothetical protein